MSQKVHSNLDLQSIARIVGLLAPSASDEPVRKLDLDNAIEGLKQKDPCVVSTQSNLNLASPGATIDGVTMAASDRVLVRNQSAAAENGIYLWNGASSAMTRAGDASTAAELNGALVPVTGGTDDERTFRQTATVTTLGTDSVTFAQFGTTAGAASETAAGIAELATQGETDTGTDDLRIVTPLKLATWAGKPKRYAASFGDGSATQYDLTHNLGSRDVLVQVVRVASPYDTIFCDVSRLDTNTVRLNFATAPTTNQFRGVIIG